MSKRVFNPTPGKTYTIKYMGSSGGPTGSTFTGTFVENRWKRMGATLNAFKDVTPAPTEKDLANGVSQDNNETLFKSEWHVFGDNEGGRRSRRKSRKSRRRQSKRTGTRKSHS